MYRLLSVFVNPFYARNLREFRQIGIIWTLDHIRHFVWNNTYGVGYCAQHLEVTGMPYVLEYNLNLRFDEERNV